MERWERDAIDNRIDRVEKEGRKIDERLRKFEWRDGERIHLNVMVLFWILIGAIVALEIAVAALKG